ncbi:MAG: hypothetical protein PHQ86_07955 [Dehalococcoidales bacterium]|nr:hypothetical protein [Dehalococcoidales bacterium]
MAGITDKKINQSNGENNIIQDIRYDVANITDDDLYLFNEGSHYRLYHKLGAHQMNIGGIEGTYFAVWVPNARQVSVIGDFNKWKRLCHKLKQKGQSGIWEGFIPGLIKGALYKYCIDSNHKRYRVEKADPLAFFSETPPKTASIVTCLDYDWGDKDWMVDRRRKNKLSSPISIYEIH